MMIAARDMTWGDSKPTEYWGLCFTALEANSTITMKRSSSLAPSVTLETSINGRTWKPFSVNNTTIQLKEAGSKVYFRAGEGGNKSLASRSGDSTLYNYFSATGKISASGSIQSLLNGDEPTEIINSAYCYYSLFRGCTSLVKAPALPATKLPSYCYSYMFFGCTSLVEAPALPATTAQTYCYYSMFSDCTSLVEAPALPATTLVLGCYNYMFDKCTLLSEVKVPFPYREWYAGDRTVHWLNGVSASGRFICHSDLGRNSSILRGTSFCPNGWVVENIENIFSQKDGQ